MTILLIIILLAFAYCLVPGRVSEPWRTRIAALLTLAAAAVILWNFLFFTRKDGGVISAKYPRSAAYMLGLQIRKDMKKKGEVVVIVNELAKWASDRHLEGLKQALEGTGLKMSQPYLETLSGESSALAPGALEKISAKHPGAVAMITFLGVPELREADKTAGLPPIYVFQTGEVDDCRAWMEAGLVWGACFYKDQVNWENAPARMSSLESAFKDRFKLATPGDLPRATPGAKEK
jgi:hypothetical protein